MKAYERQEVHNSTRKKKDAAPSPAALSPRKEPFEQVAGCAP